MGMSGRPPAKYFMALGVKPDAGPGDVATAYYQLRMEMKVEGASDERREAIDHAFRILRSYFRGSKIERRSAIRQRRGTAWRRRIGLLALFLITGVALAFALPDLRVFSGYEPGDVLHWKADDSALGVVVDYDPVHRFRVGQSVAAYEIRLAGSGDRVWISARKVEGETRKAGRAP